MPGYKKPAEAGKLFQCGFCGKTPTVGQDRYYQNIENDDSAKTMFTQNFPGITPPKWIGCVDEECFKKQGGNYDPNAKPKSFTPRKLTVDEMEERTQKGIECWTLVHEAVWQQFKNDETEGHVKFDGQVLATALEVYKGISYSWRA